MSRNKTLFSLFFLNEILKSNKLLEEKFNFRSWKTFHKLYKTEKFMYYIENFLIMNMPLIARGLFNIRYGILKLMGKR